MYISRTIIYAGHLYTAVWLNPALYDKTINNHNKEGKYMAVTEITGANFEQIVGGSEVPVLVDFWAAWCGPCRMLSPIVDAVSEEIEGIKVGKVNVDEEGELAAQFGISSIPCLILFKDGKEANRSVGMIPKEKVIEFARS